MKRILTGIEYNPFVSLICKHFFIDLPTDSVKIQGKVGGTTKYDESSKILARNKHDSVTKNVAILNKQDNIIELDKKANASRLENEDQDKLIEMNAPNKIVEANNPARRVEVKKEYKPVYNYNYYHIHLPSETNDGKPVEVNKLDNTAETTVSQIEPIEENNLTAQTQAEPVNQDVIAESKNQSEPVETNNSKPSFLQSLFSYLQPPIKPAVDFNSQNESDAKINPIESNETIKKEEPVGTNTQNDVVAVTDQVEKTPEVAKTIEKTPEVALEKPTGDINQEKSTDSSSQNNSAVSNNQDKEAVVNNQDKPTDVSNQDKPAEKDIVGKNKV